MSNPNTTHFVHDDTGTGKSSLLLRFVDNVFTEGQSSSLGVDFRFRTVKMEKKTIKLQIWDTAGQEKYRTITSAYYRGADGVILVFDVCNPDSYRHITEWKSEVNRYASENCRTMLLGNKIDKVTERQVSNETAKAYADANSLPYVEISALTGENIEAAFMQLTESMIRVKETQVQQRSIAPSSDSSRLNLHSKSEKRTGKGYC